MGKMIRKWYDCGRRIKDNISFLRKKLELVNYRVGDWPARIKTRVVVPRDQ